MKFSISILKFLFIGALFIVSNEHLYLKNTEDLAVFFDLFYVWISTLFTHSLQIVGYVINSEWLPQANQTITNTIG